MEIKLSVEFKLHDRAPPSPLMLPLALKHSHLSCECSSIRNKSLGKPRSVLCFTPKPHIIVRKDKSKQANNQPTNPWKTEYSTHSKEVKQCLSLNSFKCIFDVVAFILLLLLYRIFNCLFFLSQSLIRAKWRTYMLLVTRYTHTRFATAAIVLPFQPVTRPTDQPNAVVPFRFSTLNIRINGVKLRRLSVHRVILRFYRAGRGELIHTRTATRVNETERKKTMLRPCLRLIGHHNKCYIYVIITNVFMPSTLRLPAVLFILLTNISLHKYIYIDIMNKVENLSTRNRKYPMQFNSPSQCSSGSSFSIKDTHCTKCMSIENSVNIFGGSIEIILYVAYRKATSWNRF